MPLAELSGLSLHYEERGAGRIPGAALSVIAGSGHLFFLERPEETLELLDEFLGELG